ncbi:fimbria/pilus outer membrane usher protein [Shigella flexneri]
MCEPNVDAFWSAAWRYSSRDYRTFDDHVWANNKDNYRRDENDVYDIADYYQNDFGRKNSFSANTSQSLPEGWGAVSLSTLWRDYWGRSGSSKDYQLSYSNNLRRISYTLVQAGYDENHHEEKRFNIFISIPFDWGDDVSTPRRQYICLTQRRLMIRGLLQIIRIIRNSRESESVQLWCQPESSTSGK